jgi:hypothetical protein
MNTNQINNDAARDAGQSVYKNGWLRSIPASAAETAQELVILCEDRGDYLTGLRADGEVMGGDIENALRYTPAEAAEMVASLGRGFSAEPAAE